MGGDKPVRRDRRRLSRWDWALLLAVIALAALLRLTRLNLAEFKLDEANHYRMAYDLLQGRWRWTGSTASVGFPKPPLFIYVLAVPLAVTHDPRVVTGLLGALASLSTGAFYALLRRRLGWQAALGAALLFAFNPQAVLYARKLFTADLLPPLATLFLWASLTLLETPSPKVGRRAVLTVLAFSLLLLTTFSPVILLPVLAFVLWERRDALTWRGWAGAVAALIAPFVPYLLAVRPEVARFFSGGSWLASADGAAIGTAPVGRWILELLWGTSTSITGWMRIPAWVLTAFTVAGGVWLLDRARRQQGRWARLILIWVLICSLGMLGLSASLPVSMQFHYLVIVFPVLFVLPGAAVEWAHRRAGWLGIGALACLAGVALWYAYLWNGMMAQVAAGVEGYGTPLGYWHRAATRARTLTSDYQAVEVLTLMPGARAWDEKAVIFDALLSGTPHRIVDGSAVAVLPSQPTVLLIDSEVMGTAAAAQPCTDVLVCRLEASPFGGAYHYRLWDPEAEIASLCTASMHPATGQWASGTQLLGYRIEGSVGPGETPVVTHHWEVIRGPIEADIHWFNHLIGEEGERWAQFDGVPLPASRWQVGDHVLWTFPLAISADADPPPYELRVGQYTYPDFEGIPVVDATGVPQSDAVEVPVPVRSP